MKASESRKLNNKFRHFERRATTEKSQSYEMMIELIRASKFGISHPEAGFEMTG
jgi:hypothetical protein